MTCDEARKHLTLGGRQQEDLRRHLELCAQCRELAEKISALDELLNEWVSPQAPDLLPAKIAVRIAQELDASRPAVRFGWRAAVERALVPLVIVVGLAIGSLLGHYLSGTIGAQQSGAVASVGANGNGESALIVDPLSGSLTEAVETVTFASAGR